MKPRFTFLPALLFASLIAVLPACAATNFVLNARIQSIGSNVRSTAAGTAIAFEAAKNYGTITSGPTVATLSGTSYVWWQVSWADGTNGWSAETTLTIAPPTQVSPGTNTAGVVTVPSLQPTFNWNALAGADHYSLYISISPYGGANIIYSNLTLTGTSFLLPSGVLSSGNSYKWNMTSISKTIEGTYTSTNPLYFSTPSGTLSAPTLIGPGNTSDPGPSLSSATQTFSWNAVANATSYGLYYRDVTTGDLVNASVSSPTTSTNITLTAGHSYRWNMQASNATSLSAISQTNYFQIAVPGAPNLNSPTSVSAGGATLSWSPVSSATDYRVQVSLSQTFDTANSDRDCNNCMPSGNVVITAPTTTVDLSGLTGGTKYYYRVRAGRFVTSSEWTTAWSTTGVLTTPNLHPIAARWEGLQDGGFSPPDPHGSAGPMGVIQTVNLRIAYYNKSGALLWGPVDLSQFWASVGNAGNTDASGTLVRNADPKSIYDSRSGRFYVIMQENDVSASNTGNRSYLNVAVSKGPNPSGGGGNDWIFYRTDITETAGGVNYGGDYPGLGVDDQALYVTYNMFRLPIGSPELFKNSQIIAVNKNDLLSAVLTLHRVFTPTDGLDNSFALQPASPIGNGPANLAYFCETPFTGSASGTSVRLWALNDPLGSAVLTSATIALPNNGGMKEDASQYGTAQTIETLSPRTQGNAFWRQGSVWFCNTGGDSVASKVHYYKVAVNGFPSGTPTLAESGTIDGGPNVWTFQPSIGGNAQGDVCLVYSQSSTSMYPAVLYAIHPAEATSFDVPSTLTNSPSYNNNDKNRWGDFATVAADPTDGSFFISHEFARSSTANSWGTVWGHINPATTLTVRSFSVATLNPNNGVSVTISPHDNYGQGSRQAPYSQIYTYGTSVNLSAPSSASGNVFQKWQKNGIDFGFNTDVTVVVDGDISMIAVYNVPPKQDQTISFAALPDTTYGAPDFSVSATASSGLPVTFSIPSGPATLSNGITVSLGGAGAVTVRASQGGNSQYNAAPDVDRTFNVAKADQIITFAALENKAIGEPPVSLSASSSSGLSVGFDLLSGPASLSENVLTLTNTGSVAVRASQGGNTNYNSAFADRVFDVFGAPILGLTANGNTNILVWSTNVPGFVPEGTIALPAAWTPVPATLTIANGHYEVADPASGPTKIYRLRK